MADIQLIDRGGAGGLHAFARPIWAEVFGPMLPGGPAEAEYFFESWQSEDGIKKAMDDGFLYWYMTDGGRRVGYFAARAEGERLFISKCYLAKGERGRGLGSEMIRAMLEYGRGQGCTSAYLHVNVRNADAIRAYERNGFVRIYREIRDRGNGFATDDFVMSREI